MMEPDFSGDFINYYEYLNLPQNATTQALQVAFDRLVANTQMRLNNPLTANEALFVHNNVEPAIRQHLLTSPEGRMNYDRLLIAYQEYQMRRNELADTEGLDDFFERPFFFDPFNFDIETPANSLREIALKLDEEWPQACEWIADTTNEVHVFLSFLTHSAGRPGLVKRVEPIIQAVNGKNQQRMGVNEAIERCILLLNPRAERPLVSILNPTFTGKTWQVGDFIIDVPANSELILGHNGLRGCVFGTIESRTDWVHFPQHRTSVGFSLMPEGTDPKIGFSEVKIPLVFLLQEKGFPPKTNQRAELLIHMENHQPAREFLLPLELYVLPTPPRVIFNPLATQQQPIWVGISRQGDLVGARVTAFNHKGHQGLVPLDGRITTHDPAAKAEPGTFQHESQITLNIDTRNRPRGQKYEVVFDLDYGTTSGVQGPTTLHIQGEITPTVWQSMKRVEGANIRTGIGIASFLGGILLFAILGSILTNAEGQAWFLFLIAPFAIAWPAHLVWKTLLAHRQIAGETPSRPEQTSRWVIWGIPSAIGLLLCLLCVLVGGWAIFITALFGGIAGGIFGFVKDGVLAKATGQPPMPR
jgi:hypothetical protein